MRAPSQQPHQLTRASPRQNPPTQKQVAAIPCEKRWRRGRDSNPRWAYDPRPLSKRIPSAARSPLQAITSEPNDESRTCMPSPIRPAQHPLTTPERSQAPQACRIQEGRPMPAAEEEGFEPPVPCSTAVFKTAAFDHSATPPNHGPYKTI